MVNQKNKNKEIIKINVKKESKIKIKKKSSLIRLTYKDKHALETLPEIIKNYLLEIKIQQDILSVANLFQSNPDLFNIASSKLKEIDSELNLAEQKWLELEIKRETLELNLS
ncbi:MAG TPA: hypothetical protein EYG07_04790 [Alphaproteobacteria bacterium]|nr:hypothetical protein [Alphaproteobacteria bacterium]